MFLLSYPAAQVLWLGSHVVVFSSCGLQTSANCTMKESLYKCRIEHVVWIAAVTGQLCLQPAAQDLWLGGCYIG